MAGDLKAKYGTNGQVITVTVASVTNNSARAATAIDNSTNVFVDALVGGKLKSPAASTSAAGYVNVRVAATVDGGTNYTEAATGTDAAITLTSPSNAPIIGTINMVANGTTYPFGPFSVANAFGGNLPDHWVVIFENKTGGTLDATGGNHLVDYQGILAQYS